MKINDARINNWQPPGDKWWAGLKARPTEPLIDATISMTLSYAEYEELLARNEREMVEAPNKKLKNAGPRTPDVREP